MLCNQPVKNSLWQKGTDLGKNIFSLVHGQNKSILTNPVEIVTDSKLLQMQANQDFQRTSLNLSGTTLICYFLFVISQKCHPKLAIAVTSSKLNILIGNKYFHSRLSNWSILNRGKVHLNHMITNIKKNVFPKNQRLDGI